MSHLTLSSSSHRSGPAPNPVPGAPPVVPAAAARCPRPHLVRRAPPAAMSAPGALPPMISVRGASPTTLSAPGALAAMIPGRRSIIVHSSQSVFLGVLLLVLVLGRA